MLSIPKKVSTYLVILFQGTLKIVISVQKCDDSFPKNPVSVTFEVIFQLEIYDKIFHFQIITDHFWMIFSPKENKMTGGH